jgi:hypothetical protein
MEARENLLSQCVMRDGRCDMTLVIWHLAIHIWHFTLFIYLAASPFLPVSVSLQFAFVLCLLTFLCTACFLAPSALSGFPFRHADFQPLHSEGASQGYCQI